MSAHSWRGTGRSHLPDLPRQYDYKADANYENWQIHPSTTNPKHHGFRPHPFAISAQNECKLLKTSTCNSHPFLAPSVAVHQASVFTYPSKDKGDTVQTEAVEIESDHTDLKGLTRQVSSFSSDSASTQSTVQPEPSIGLHAAHTSVSNASTFWPVKLAKMASDQSISIVQRDTSRGNLTVASSAWNSQREDTTSEPQSPVNSDVKLAESLAVNKSPSGTFTLSTLSKSPRVIPFDPNRYGKPKRITTPTTTPSGSMTPSGSATSPSDRNAFQVAQGDQTSSMSLSQTKTLCKKRDIEDRTTTTEEIQSSSEVPLTHNRPQSTTSQHTSEGSDKAGALLTTVVSRQEEVFPQISSATEGIVQQETQVKEKDNFQQPKFVEGKDEFENEDKVKQEDKAELEYERKALTSSNTNMGSKQPKLLTTAGQNEEGSQDGFQMQTNSQAAVRIDSGDLTKSSWAQIARGGKKTPQKGKEIGSGSGPQVQTSQMSSNASLSLDAISRPSQQPAEQETLKKEHISTTISAPISTSVSSKAQHILVLSQNLPTSRSSLQISDRGNKAVQALSPVEEKAGKLVDKMTEAEYLKWFRRLSPQEKGIEFKRQQEESMNKIGDNILKKNKKATTSLADLHKSREAPKFMPENKVQSATPAFDDAERQQLAIGPATSDHQQLKDASAKKEMPEIRARSSKPVSELPEKLQLAIAPATSEFPKLEDVKKEKGRPMLPPLEVKNVQPVPSKPSPLRNGINASEQSSKHSSKWVHVSKKGDALVSSKWATDASMNVKAPEDDDKESDGWASSIPSEACSADSASKPTRYGKLFKQAPEANPDTLVNWDGTFAPPPADWYDRPLYNNNDPSFIGLFDRWLQVNVELTTGQPDQNIKDKRLVRADTLKDTDLWPDGIGLVEKDTTVDAENCRDYGYDENARDTIRDKAQRVVPRDFEDWAKVDLRDEMNALHNDETAAWLVKNYNGHKVFEGKKRANTIEQLRICQANNDREIALLHEQNAPIANIYLRPVVRHDIPQLVDLYNDYVKATPRTTENQPIDRHAMEERFFAAINDKLPFFVALSKRVNNVKAKKRGQQNTFQQMHAEKIVGYAIAQDFSGPCLAEKYTAELELYVHHEWYHKGVGKSLLDKLLGVCDPGYVPKGGYFFHCPPEISNIYGPGGQRDLISLVFVIRHYQNHPTIVDDYPILREWLAKYQFEEQGHLKACSVKHGRMCNMGYLVRRTYYFPKDGNITC